jgi:hypothetical protein
MKGSHLRACAKCSRHVRVSESACPFCGVALSEAFRASPAPLPPRARLSRAALFAFGTGTLALAPGCSSSSPDLVQDSGPGSSPAYGGFPDDSGPAYGGFPIDSGPEDAGTDAAEMGTSADAAETGTPADAAETGTSADAGDAGDDGPAEIFDAAYGAPPLED